MKTSFIIAFFAALSLCEANAQTHLGFAFDPSVKVRVGVDTLAHPWDGGLNFVQFSDIDVDFDGDMDLFVFDRSGDQISLFTTETVNGGLEYVYKHGGHSLFPADVRYRAAMVDYDNDGRNDLFTYAIGGVKVYRNVGNPVDGLQWELASPLLYSQYPEDYTNLYISSSDIPAFVDVDSDGDIDILTFNIGGERMEYHKNQSMELYGVPDSLEFVVMNECWGKFMENISTNEVELNSSDFPCGSGNIPNPERPQAPLQEEDPEIAAEPVRHAGSTILALDMNANGVLDLILGDVAYTTLTLLLNGGGAPNTNSAMVSQQQNFPQNTIPANIHLFPAPFFVDVNHDGVRDLIVGANAKTISQNQKSVTYYENTGADNQPVFQFRSKAFLQGDMIDAGLGSVPMLFDENGDGKRDLLIANFFRYKDVAEKECTWLLYRNTGTSSQPEYTYLNDNYLEIASEINDLRTLPAFGDIDGDGDEDIVIGLASGQVRLMTNTAGPGSSASFGAPVALTDNTGANVATPSWSAPQLFDLNDDGRLDLVVGTKTGELFYYENTGTVTAPQFTLRTQNLGGVDVAPAIPDGYSIPHFFRTNDTTHLFVGAYDGRLHYYNNVDGHLHADSSFYNAGSAYLGIDVGLYSSFWVEDIDNDGLLNMFVGQDLGGVHLLEADPNSILGLEDLQPREKQWILFPNPGRTTVTISHSNESSGNAVAGVYSVLGQKMEMLEIAGSAKLDISSYPAGIYIVEIVSGQSRETLRLVKD
jgi:hypothetical protein